MHCLIIFSFPLFFFSSSSSSVHHDQQNGIIPFALNAQKLAFDRQYYDNIHSLNRNPSHYYPSGSTIDAPLKFFFSPWSPPAWMKTNNQMTGSSFPCLKSATSYRKSWALYFSKFLSSYSAAGIDFWGFTTQNEPEYAANWEACVWTAEEQRDFVRDYLGPVIEQYNQENNKSVNIVIFDHNKDHIVNWTNIVLSDSSAAKYIWGTAVHWYSGDQFENLLETHTNFPRHSILASEACLCPPADSYNDFLRAEKYAHDIIGDLNNFVVAWTDWNILLDKQGGPNHLNNFCDSGIRVDLSSQPPAIHYQPIYYAMAHFSRYIPANSRRIFHHFLADNNGTVHTGGLEVVAFLVEGAPADLEMKKALFANQRNMYSMNYNMNSHIVLTVLNPTNKIVSWKMRLPNYEYNFVNYSASHYSSSGEEENHSIHTNKEQDNVRVAYITSAPHSLQSFFFH